MKKRILRYFKHLSYTMLCLTLVAITVGLWVGASVHYGDHPALYKITNEGPYVFYENDSVMSVAYINGSRAEGYLLDQELIPNDAIPSLSCYFQLDTTSFNFALDLHPKTPNVSYEDTAPILAVSDIESGYRTFRDFLIANQIIDNQLNWIFGKGHLVLVGDFVDRGNSTTQVLWLIYKLEQEAKSKGGHVHFILGNHELKNLQGNYSSASERYFRVASVLKRKPQELYSKQSVLGNWLLTKNPVEIINGTIFTHGGLHPDFANTDLNLAEMAEIIRSEYDNIFYPKATDNIRQQLISTKTGPCWYRGYFEDDLAQQDIDALLTKFNAKSIVVGHTIQSKVNRTFDGKVIGIDVRHPKDYHKNWPAKASEGLLIDNGEYYRVLATGEKIKI